MDYNPRWVAFMKAHGKTVDDDWKTYDYIIWVTKKSNEFKKMHNVQQLTDRLHAEFTNWLQKEVAQ